MPAKNTIVFLCAAGAAKSVIAAAYFNRLAEERALPFDAIAAAAEEPYAAVPAPVADFLHRDGFDVHAFKPRHVEDGDITNAARVVSIECNLDALDLSGKTLDRWDGVPQPSEDLDGSAAAIRRHVEALAEELRGRR